MKYIIFLLLITSPAMGATTGSLLLSGIVAAVSSLVVTPNGTNNTSLNLTGGEAAKNVATIAETSNDVLGYKITVASTNGGTLNNTLDITKKVSYKISYDGAAYVTPTILPLQVKNLASLAALTTHNSLILVNITAAPTLVAGTYNDTLLFTIVAN